MGGYKFKRLAVIIALNLGVYNIGAIAAEIQFNTDVLDVADKKNLNLSLFSHAGYIMPGDYRLTVLVNQQNLSEQEIVFYAPPEDSTASVPCLTSELVKKFGLKEDYYNKLSWHASTTEPEQCLRVPLHDGWQLTPDLGTSVLRISIPQAYLDYIDDNWDPPSRWEDGIFGMMLDYNMNAMTSDNAHRGRSSNISANGTAGMNLGAWRARADWQFRIDNKSYSSSQHSLVWNRYYLYRAIKSIYARLSIGEDYLDSDLFDSFRFTGATLRSDDNMLPPNLRGYAPEVTGVAKTNAKVTIRQQGAVLYQSQVAPGPFRIQDLSDAVNGQLDVEVEEQDGSLQKFSIQTSSIPYLTRPGTLRYKLSSGRPSDWQHHFDGPLFALGEFSWGVSNGWSLYGGNIANSDYQASALGIGRDLMILGALSFDVTRSHARLPQSGIRQGNSYRLSYSKRFDDYSSQITFAGYRFAEKGFMSMSDFLDSREYDMRNHSLKEMYSVNFNQHISAINANLYLDYNHRTYWNAATEDRYSASISRYFDIFKLKGVNASINAYQSLYQGRRDNGGYLSFSIPWGDNGSLNISSSHYPGESSNQLSYFSTLENGDNYQVGVGRTGAKNTANGFYTHYGDSFKMNANASYQEKNFSALGMGLQGGVTVTAKGAALHRINMPGATRILLDTDGVEGIPLRGYGGIAHSNIFGKTIITDVNSYYRSRFSVDLNKLENNVDAVNSITQATLTEGAIGYRRFDIIKGEKALVIIRLKDGSSPPLGASVVNDANREVGIVNDDGSAYLTGITSGATMTVGWGQEDKCRITFPSKLNHGSGQLLLPCIPAI